MHADTPSYFFTATFSLLHAFAQPQSTHQRQHWLFSKSCRFGHYFIFALTYCCLHHPRSSLISIFFSSNCVLFLWSSQTCVSKISGMAYNNPFPDQSSFEGERKSNHPQDSSNSSSLFKRRRVDQGLLYEETEYPLAGNYSHLESDFANSRGEEGAQPDNDSLPWVEGLDPFHNQQSISQFFPQILLPVDQSNQLYPDFTYSEDMVLSIDNSENSAVDSPLGLTNNSTSGQEASYWPFDDNILGIDQVPLHSSIMTETLEDSSNVGHERDFEFDTCFGMVSN